MSTESTIKPQFDFDITAAYYKFLEEDPDMTMPVAAIEAMVALLSQEKPSTSSEVIKLLQQASTTLKNSIKNSVSLSAGCDLFMRFVLRNIDSYNDWESCREHLVKNGRLFVERAKASRDKIAKVGLPFIRDDDVILVHSQSRTVQALLAKAAEQFIRFSVYVTESRISDQGRKMASFLRKHDIPTCVIPDSAVGFVIDKVDKIFFGAEGVVESGGVINQMGSYQIAVLAKTSNKPVYVVAESHKFVRLFPISPDDVPTEYSLEFSTEDDDEDDMTQRPQIDFTPHQFVTALITDLGVLTTSGVSEELIKIWFD